MQIQFSLESQPANPYWETANSPLAIWFFSTILVGIITLIYRSISDHRASSKDKKRELRQRREEFTDSIFSTINRYIIASRNIHEAIQKGYLTTEVLSVYRNSYNKAAGAMLGGSLLHSTQIRRLYKKEVSTMLEEVDAAVRKIDEAIRDANDAISRVLNAETKKLDSNSIDMQALNVGITQLKTSAEKIANAMITANSSEAPP